MKLDNKEGFDINNDNITTEEKFDNSIDNYYDRVNKKEILPLINDFLNGYDNKVDGIFAEEYKEKLIIYKKYIIELQNNIDKGNIVTLGEFTERKDNFLQVFNYKNNVNIIFEKMEEIRKLGNDRELIEKYNSIYHIFRDIFRLIIKINKIYNDRGLVLNQEINKVYVQIEEEVDKQNDLAELDDLLDDAYL